MSGGTPPSLALQRVFQKISAWLMVVYKRLRTKPDVELTPEVRRVFDRMLATVLPVK